VKLGDMSDGFRIITDGLNPGDKIIVDGVQRAHPGAEVKPEVVDMQASNAPAAAAPATPAPSGDAPKDAPKDQQKEPAGDSK